MTLLAVYFQLTSSNYSCIVELYNFQLNAVNKTIHTLDKFSYIATFYKLECLSQYLVHFSTYRVTFQTRPCIFSTKLMNFCLHYSDHWSRPGSPWLFDLIRISDCLITKTVAIKNSPKTVKLIQKVLLLREEIHTPVKRLILSLEKQ